MVFTRTVGIKVMQEITTYKDFTHGEALKSKVRDKLRAFTIAALSLNKDIATSSNWIKLPYYHHVFDDERKGFERQLKYLKNFGDFISMDQVCELVQGKQPLEGKFFCVSFDDGYYSCYSNMMEISYSLNVPVIIYLPTDYIGLDVNNSYDQQKMIKNLPNNPKLLTFLSWKNCQEMMKYKVTFGSHTCSHANLSKLDSTAIELELKRSKEIIEKNLNTECFHFACPWGRKGIDFHPEITTQISKNIGYKTFATTNRGKMEKGDDLYTLRRDHLLANWDNFQLKYFFGK